jgi:hypothetical protein
MPQKCLSIGCSSNDDPIQPSLRRRAADRDRRGSGGDLDGTAASGRGVVRIRPRSRAGAAARLRRHGASGPRPLATGSAFPGFHVETAEAPSELGLAGRHRFSTYLLSFRLEDAGSGRTKLVAETRAAFPGLKGSAYRALVIGTRMHVLVTKRRAERS